MYIYVQDIGIMVSVFANGPGDQGSIPYRVIPKTQKWYLMTPCLTLSFIRYGSMVKWSNPGKGVVSFPTLWCGSYWKGRLGGHPRLRLPTLLTYIFIELATRVQILDKVACFYFMLNAFKKSMNPSVLPSGMDRQKGRLILSPW